VSEPRILLIGAGGQLGQELARLLPAIGTVLSRTRNEIDLEDLDALGEMIRSERPDVVVNAAAYTNVDQAETEPDRAARINAAAPGVIARAAKDLDAVMIHYSTDYVFDGSSAVPYTERDQPAPRTAYGRSKADGDAEVLASGARAYIFRVGWVYSLTGRNFLATIRRALNAGSPLRVVDDQYGSPTWSRAIANASIDALRQILADGATATARAPGVYHMSAPDYTTWYQFAAAIAAATPSASATSVNPIAAREYPTVATRPARSELDPSHLAHCFGIVLPGWREQLRRCLSEH
jgi:dTDP-4-dehydrorhamnose reductase